MDYQEYVRRVQEVDRRVRKGDYASALELLYSLIDSDLADADKAVMCMNIAIIWDRLGQPEEALRWYGRGMGYERHSGGHFVAESRAAYLAQLGRLEESLRAYEDLLARATLDEQTRERIRQNINRLRARLE